ncbi:Type IV pilus biogenesis protein PilQ [Chitinispirillum alkaliphilum]|nr:Type IV pilus biogenesis protein PilQ [Chitinispirillum alkaliphilum]
MREREMIKVRLSMFLFTVLLGVNSVYSWNRTDEVYTADNAAYTANQSVDPVIDLFEVHKAEIRSVFRQLSDHSGMDIVVGNEVTGSVSMSVTRKTWREILAIVCRVHNLTPIVENNYIYIITQEEFQRRKVGSAAAMEASEIASPLVREIIRLRFTTASNMYEVVNSLLSSRGKATVSDHSNAIIIFDTEENIRQVRQVVSDLDVQSPQVSITCKIIEVTTGMVQKMGIHWGVTEPSYNVTAEHLSADNVIADQAINRVTYGILTPDRLRVALEYLYEDNDAEVVAQPQITTLDNKQARVFMGQQIPVRMRDEAGNTVIQMVNAGTELVVTPHVSGDDMIMLSLNPKKESYNLLADGLPVINEQSAATNVFVRNGETVVIAGLTSNEQRTVETGIPVLKNIPLIGALFKRSIKNVDNRDLIIFVTPKIIPTDI